MHNGRPVYFASRSLNKTEMEYAQIEKELLATTFSCKKFHNYIYGHGMYLCILTIYAFDINY